MSTTDPTTNPELRLTPGRWTLDASRSRAEFSVPHMWGLGTAKGYFKEQEGSLTIDANQQWSMELALDAASLDTSNPRRDKDLRSAKFFNVDQHPTVTFRSTNVTATGDRLSVTGELTAAGTTVAIEVETTVTRSGDEIELDAAATVDPRGFGMSRGPLGMVGTAAALHVHALLTPQHLTPAVTWS